MARNRNAAVDTRQLWATNVAPYVVAAREGARHAARTAGRERARANATSWWRRRWVVAAGAGLFVAASAGGAYALGLRLRDRSRAAGGSAQATAPVAATATGDQPERTLKSTVVAGREKVTDIARTMLHRIRREVPDGGEAREGREKTAPVGSGTIGGPAATNGSESRPDLPTTGTGYAPGR